MCPGETFELQSIPSLFIPTFSTARPQNRCGGRTTWHFSAPFRCLFWCPNTYSGNPVLAYLFHTAVKTSSHVVRLATCITVAGDFFVSVSFKSNKSTQAIRVSSRLNSPCKNQAIVRLTASSPRTPLTSYLPVPLLTSCLHPYSPSCSSPYLQRGRP